MKIDLPHNNNSNNKVTPLPVTANDLILKLDKLYPEKAPDPADDEREIWMKAGERRLVKALLHKLHRENSKGKAT